MENKISICIPTYNRAPFLEILLKSVEEEIINDNLKEKIEICISDNASTDNTENLIKKYQLKMNINYNKNLKNIGAGANFIKSVSLASYDYCWIVGSDDVIKEGAIVKIIEKINLHNKLSIYLYNRICTDINLKNSYLQNWNNKIVLNEEITLNDVERLEKYFDNCNSLGGIFSYLSSIVFNREEWENINLNRNEKKSPYSHVYKLFGILKKNKKFMYFSEPIVYSRGENDSFLTNVKQRYFLDYNEYLKIVNKYVKNKKLQKKFIKILVKEHSYRHLMILGGTSKLNMNEYQILKKIYPRYYIWFYIFFEKNKYIYRFLKNLKEKIKH